MYQSFDVVRRAVAAGCKANTPAGLVRFIRSRQLPATARQPAPRPSGPLKCGHVALSVGMAVPAGKLAGWRRFALQDAAMAANARDAARQLYPSRRNWDAPAPCIDAAAHGSVNEVNHGRYSGRCSYIRWSYCPLYHSAVAIRPAGRAAALLQAGKVVRIVRAPAGTRFGADQNGVFVRRKDGTEYHLDAADFLARNFAARVRAAMTSACRRRQEAAQAAKVAARHAAEMSQCRVQWQDSVRAGNCQYGTASFCGRHGIAWRGNPYASVKAATLRRIAGADAARVEAAIACAWQRETLVSI